MGFLTKLFGSQKRQQKPYVNAGVALIYRLTECLNLATWQDGLPNYTGNELQAIERTLSNFQKLASDVAGGDATFHKSIVPDLQRSLAGQALFRLAADMRKSSDDELRSDWKECVATYLKGWASDFNPQALFDVGTLLIKAKYLTEAKETFRVLLLLPTYADNLYGTSPKKKMLVERYVNSATESLRVLD